jgi:alcohol dehydrogenase
LGARGELLIGARFGGLAIENSSLGAAHACAYALTGQLGMAHGVAIAVVLDHVVEWNRQETGSWSEEPYPEGLVQRLRDLAAKAGLPASLREAGVQEEAIPRLSEDAGAQWAGKFNPRSFDAAGALEIFQRAL